VGNLYLGFISAEKSAKALKEYFEYVKDKREPSPYFLAMKNRDSPNHDN
jgi:hypothetical protein